MTKLKKTGFFIYIIIGYFIFSGDDCEDKELETSVSNPSNVSIRLESVDPRVLNSPSDNFQIKVKLNASSGATYNIALRVKGPNGCYAISVNNLFSMSSGTTTYSVTNDFASTCNAPGVYTIKVEAIRSNPSEVWDSNEETITLVGGNQNTAKVEYDYHQGYDLWDLQGSISSFSGANVQFDKGTDSQSQLNFTPEAYVVSDLDDLDDLIFEDYYTPSSNTKNLPAYPLHLVMTHDVIVPAGVTSINGVTYDSEYKGQEINSVFIFVHRISRNWGSFCPPPNLNTCFPPEDNSAEGYARLKSAVSTTIQHEFIHLLSNISDPNEHYTHSNDHTNTNWCVLDPRINNDNREYFENGIFVLKKTSWFVCQRHIGQVANGPFYSQDNNSVSGKNNYREIANKSKIQISLEKETYKKFEPILLKVDIINNGTSPDTISNLVNSNFNIVVKDENGKVYNKFVTNKHYFALFPDLIVQPGDTATIIKKVNNLGELSSKEDTYFNLKGHFIPGTYLVYVQSDDNEENSMSNIETFKVKNLSIEDKEVLNLYKKKDYLKVIKEYKGNDFFDDIYAYYVTNRNRPQFSKDFGELSEIIDLYTGFINSNKSSYYLMQYEFIGYMFLKFSFLSDNLENQIKYFQDLFSETKLAKLLNDNKYISELKQKDFEIKQEKNSVKDK